MNASKQLLSELIPDRLDQVVVTNLDPLVRQIVLSTETDFTPCMIWLRMCRKPRIMS